MKKYSFRAVDFVNDLDILFRIYAETRTEELAALAWTEEQKKNFLLMQFNAQKIYYLENYKQADFLMIEIEKHPAGRLYLAKLQDEIRIIDIALLPEYHRLGIGTQILQTILADAHSKHLDVSIHVERNNPALQLYHRLGFKLVEDKGVYLFLRRPYLAETAVGLP